MTNARPLLAWIAAAILASALGASLSVGLTAALGFWEWPFLGWVWLWLAAIGAVVALIGGGAIALAATALARVVRPPRPAADIIVGALGALGLLLGLRALLLAAAGEPGGFAPPGLGPVLGAPLVAGAACGWLYWRLAGKPPHPDPDED